MSSLEYNIRVHADWSDPEPREVSFRLAKLRDYLIHTEAPMMGAEFIAISDIEEHFEREETPEGIPWEDWAESYAFTAAQENVGILRKTEDLFYAAINPANYTVIPQGLYFDPGGLPEYWLFVHDGTDKIPARPFIGLSEEAQLAIEALFLEWLEGGLELGARGRVRVLRAPTGQFISGI